MAAQAVSSKALEGTQGSVTHSGGVGWGVAGLWVQRGLRHSRVRCARGGARPSAFGFPFG